MRVALPRLLLAVLLLVPLGASAIARAQSLSEPLAALLPMSYLPIITRSEVSAASVADVVEQQVIDLTNALRAGAGCPAVRASPVLVAAARAHSYDMAANSFFDHTGSDGSSAVQRIERAGYHARISAENIAAGFATPESVVTAWSTSPGHRANLLNCDVTEVGVGYVFDAVSEYGHYWTQDFGRP